MATDAVTVATPLMPPPQWIKLASKPELRDVASGIYPNLDHTTTNHFRAKDVHQVQLDCADARSSRHQTPFSEPASKLRPHPKRPKSVTLRGGGSGAAGPLFHPELYSDGRMTRSGSAVASQVISPLAQRDVSMRKSPLELCASPAKLPETAMVPFSSGASSL